MTGAKSLSVPFASHFNLSADMIPKRDEEMEQMSSIPYSSVVGRIMYATVCTCPDISHVVSVLSRYMACLSKEHWQALKWILKYFRGTTDVGLTFYNDKLSESVVSYVDSDYAGDLDKRRSLTCYVFILSGSVISWKATLHSVVTLSTREIEYMALTEAVKEAFWIQGLVIDLGLSQKKTPDGNWSKRIVVDSATIAADSSFSYFINLQVATNFRSLIMEFKVRKWGTRKHMSIYVS
ncbi:secreted RxLR effector protein 161-like [Nicotiana sylvestris]|uniref:secreted RxLR effector protein 161-like n=1 Tax=Nicotiana sylvestris TaxID=4096 RepID=UPI00388CBAD0